MKKEPTYLGDGLYADFDGYQIRLFTPQGNEVFLEPSVLARFEHYCRELFKPQVEAEKVEGSEA